jgi:hypothetical protein
MYKHAVNWVPKALVLGYALLGATTAFFSVGKGKLGLYQIAALSAGVAAVLLIFQKDFWLPFLGDTVLPLDLIPVKDIKQEGGLTLQVDAPRHSKVIYWAAQSIGNLDISTAIGPKQAYGDYSNSGVVLADDNNKATINVHPPRGYTVEKPLRGKMTLPRHIHYRVADPTGAWIGPVQTIFV